VSASTVGRSARAASVLRSPRPPRRWHSLPSPGCVSMRVRVFRCMDGCVRGFPHGSSELAPTSRACALLLVRKLRREGGREGEVEGGREGGIQSVLHNNLYSRAAPRGSPARITASLAGCAAYACAYACRPMLPRQQISSENVFFLCGHIILLSNLKFDFIFSARLNLASFRRK